MAKKIAGINLEIGGNTAGLNKAFASTDRQLRKTANELKDVERYLKLDPTNAELLAQKEKLLGDQIEQTAHKAELLEKAQKAADKAIEKGTKISEEQYRKLQREVIGTNSAMKQLESQAKDLADAAEKAAGALDDVSEAEEELDGGFSVAKGSVADFVGNAATSFVESISDMAEESREFRTEMALLEAAGTAHGYSTEQTSEAYKYLYSVLGDETAARTALNNAQALGMSQTDLMGLLQSGIGAWGKYGDSIPIDGLMEAINETSKVGQITGVLADALNWAGINEDTFNEKLKSCSSEQERQKLIAEALNGEYAGLADSYMKNNEELIKFNESTLKQNEATARIGEKLQPIQDKLTEIKTNCLDKIADAFIFIEQHSTIFTVLLGLIGALTVGIGAYNAVQTVKNILDAAQNSNLLAATAAQIGLNAAMLASPITWIVALIVGLVATFAILWNKCDAFRNFWIEAWDKIKETFTTVANFIKDNWKELTTFLVNPVAGAIALLYKLNPKFKEWVDGLVARVKEWFSGMRDIGANIISGIWNGIGDKVEWLKGKVMGVVDKIKSWFTGKDGFDTHSPSKWSEGVTENVMEGGAIGFSKVRKVLNAVKSSVGKIKNTFSSEMSGGRVNVLTTSAGKDSGSVGGKSKIYPNVTNNYYGYKGTISENNAAMKKTIRNMEVSLA